MSGNGGDAQASLHDDALSLGQRLAKLAIKRIIAPLVVAGHIGLDEAIEQIKLEVVAALADTGEANGFLAGHVSKSRSWFQDYLRKAREEERRPVAGRADSGELTGSGYDTTYGLMSKVVVALLAVYPDAMPISSLREQIDLPLWRMTDEELSRQLVFFSKLGVIRVVGYNNEGPLLQVTEQFSVTGPRPGQLERVEERLGWVLPLASAYCMGKGDFGGFVGKLSPRALAKARGRLREAAADIFAEAIADTHKSDEPEDSDVQVRVIIAIGETGGLDE